MDFVMGLSRVRGRYNALWFITDWLTKQAHFVPVKDNMDTKQLGKIYVREVVKLHKVPRRIVSDKDTQLVSTFWYGLQKALGTRLSFSIAYHLQIDGQTEKVNQIIKDMSKVCCLDHRVSWIDVLPLMEFTYCSSQQTSIQMTPMRHFIRGGVDSQCIGMTQEREMSQ